MTKFFRRTVAGISALSILAAIPGLTAFAAETAPEFKEDQLPVVLYSQENMSQIDCRYYADMPSIPYVKLGDFYGMWAGKDIEITKSFSVPLFAGIYANPSTQKAYFTFHL